MEFKSKYSGTDIDRLLDKVNNGDVGKVDASLSTTSENPVMNLVVTAELRKKVNTSDVATINGQSILDGGDIIIQGGGDSPIVSGEGHNSSILKDSTSTATGELSSAFGRGSNAEGKASFATGNSVASGDYSHAEGVAAIENGVTRYTKAIGKASHAEGEGCHASATGAHAEGMWTDAQKNGSHAEGYKTVAGGQYSHVEGNDSQTIGNISHAEGKNCIANGRASHAEGWYTITNNEGEHASGKYNVSNSDTQFSIGIGTSDANRKNAFEVKRNGDIYVEGVEGRIQDKLNEGGASSITYNELKNLRDNGKLIAGMQYRITDYVTTTAQENTRSAGHQFDIIVLALTNNKLSEQAHAAIHEGDTYFTEAGANLSAWKIWYCLDNNKERFAWASPYAALKVYDGSNDMTYIYRRYKEADNSQFAWAYVRNADDLNFDGVTNWDDINSSDVIYTDSDLPKSGEDILVDGDIYEIQTYKQEGKGVIYRLIDEWNNDCPYDFKNVQFKRNLNFDEGHAQFSEAGDETWVYTFAGQSHHIDNDEWSDMLDGSLESPFGHMSDENSSTFHDNTIMPYIMLYNGNDIYTECGIRYLNDIVFLGHWRTIGSANNEDVPYYSAYCCYSNSFGYNCYSNSLCYGCHSNSFGNGCCYNSFGYYCYSNSFGYDCYSNSFGNDCRSNSFGNGCCYNSFGYGCAFNSFGNGCGNNNFGDNCHSNGFGNGCWDNIFIDHIGKAHDVRYCRLDDGVSRVQLYIDEDPVDYQTIQNHHVHRGVSDGVVECIGNTEHDLNFARNEAGYIISFTMASLINS